MRPNYLYVYIHDIIYVYIHDILQLFMIRIRIGKFLTLDTIPIISVHKIRDRS